MSKLFIVLFALALAFTAGRVYEQRCPVQDQDQEKALGPEPGIIKVPLTVTPQSDCPTSYNPAWDHQGPPLPDDSKKRFKFAPHGIH